MSLPQLMPDDAQSKGDLPCLAAGAVHTLMTNLWQLTGDPMPIQAIVLSRPVLERLAREVTGNQRISITRGFHMNMPGPQGVGQQHLSFYCADDVVLSPRNTSKSAGSPFTTPDEDSDDE